MSPYLLVGCDIYTIRVSKVSGYKETVDYEKATKIIEENRDGLESLAKEEEAEEEIRHPVKTKIKRLYKKYVKKPKADPLVI